MQIKACMGTCYKKQYHETSWNQFNVVIRMNEIAEQKRNQVLFFTRSDIDIDQLQISQQDLRLLEILTIRYLSLSHLNQVLDDPKMSVFI